MERRGNSSTSMKERKAFLLTARTRPEFIRRVYDLEGVTRSLPWDLLLFTEFEMQKNWRGIESMSKHPDLSWIGFASKARVRVIGVQRNDEGIR